MPPALVVAGIFALTALAVGVLIWAFVYSGDRARQRLVSIGSGEAQGAPSVQRPAGVRTDTVPLLTAMLQGTDLWQKLQLQLIRSGLLLRPSELVAICLFAGLIGVGIAMVLTGSLMQGILVGAVCAVIPYFVIKGREQRRLKTLASQLPDALDMLGSSLRSGFALLRAMQVVRTQMHPPIAEEFGRVVDEVQYGISIEEALDNLIARTGSYDLELVVAAIQTQLSVGGNLAEIFDSIAGMIRERVKLMGEISAATAEGRLSAGILLALPFIMAFLVNMLSPGYMAPLFREPLGLLMVGAGLVLMAIGTIVIRKLIDIDV